MNDRIWQRFDMIAVQEFTGYRDRHPSIVRELYRVGIREFETFWQHPNPYDRIVMEHIRLSSGVSKIVTFSCTMGHYRILRTAYDLGVEHLLVMEDDCRWIADEKKLAAAVEGIPTNADYCKFEWFFGRRQAPEERRAIVSRPKINGAWIDAHDVLAVGAGAVCYNRRAMEWKLGFLEDPARRPGTGKLRVIDMYDRPWPLDASLRAYLAVPLAAVQADHPDGKTVNETSKDYSVLTESGTTEGYGSEGKGGERNG